MNNTMNCGVAFVLMGIFFFLGIRISLNYINPAEIRHHVCKQLYTTTKDYIDCSQDTQALDEIINKVQPIK